MENEKTAAGMMAAAIVQGWIGEGAPVVCGVVHSLKEETVSYISKKTGQRESFVKLQVVVLPGAGLPVVVQLRDEVAGAGGIRTKAPRPDAGKLAAFKVTGWEYDGTLQKGKADIFCQ